MKIRLFSLLAIGAISGLLVTGCTSEPVFKALERPATASDALPEEMTFGPQLEIEKVLLVAEENGKKYFLGRDAASQTICVAVHPVDNPTNGVSSCSMGIPREGELLKTSGPDQESTILVSDGFDTSEIEDSGWKRIHENILTTDY